MAQQSITETTTDPLDMWDRIRKAIYAATVNRHEVMLHLPECHRKNCHRHNGDDVDLVFGMFTDAIAESVHTELLCEATTNPDLGPDATDCETLQDRMAGAAGPWTECEHHPRQSWLDAATRAETQLGYWDWVRAKHDLRFGLSRAKTVPLAITRDECAYAQWWAALTESAREELADNVNELAAADSVLLAESLNCLMRGVFHENGRAPWLTISGLAPRAAIDPVSLDIDPAYDSEGALDGVNVVLRMYATIGDTSRYQKFTAYVDRPHRELVPVDLRDAATAIGQVIDWAAELITGELVAREQFWRAVR
ncbi:hypothetical protein [Mycolicibacterium llatzerense]|uniref:hypothetical protein n=1 Tax=Mycolicibacterium llatzerense TaxID=280871 RepID=UPI0021B5A19B|nr:hypothetical protein [Mycolicibacterium llatzerense]MCT7373276.1 hypothetical protein [Mycolicibacterium llatzerense]